MREYRQKVGNSIMTGETQANNGGPGALKHSDCQLCLIRCKSPDDNILPQFVLRHFAVTSAQQASRPCETVLPLWAMALNDETCACTPHVPGALCFHSSNSSSSSLLYRGAAEVCGKGIDSLADWWSATIILIWMLVYRKRILCYRKVALS